MIELRGDVLWREGNLSSFPEDDQHDVIAKMPLSFNLQQMVSVVDHYDNKFLYLLRVVGSKRDQSGNVEHNLPALVFRIDTVCASQVR